MGRHDASTEFPPGADQPPGALDRREWMKLLAAGLGLAGATACAERRREKILPYVEQPPEVTPGVPLAYATSHVLDGFAVGLVVQSHEGRPTKVEGNPEHPASLGATGVYEQASVLDVYDPARLRGPLRGNAPALWDRAVAELRRASSQGAPPWIVMYPQSSPSLGAVLDRVRERYPGVRVSFHSPLERRAAYATARRLYGRPLDVQYRFDRARVVVSLGADFLASMPMSLRWARDFASRRRPASPDGTTNRLYVAETMFTPTGSLADHRVAVPPSGVRPAAAALLRELIAAGLAPEGLPEAVARDLAAVAAPNEPWIRAAARDLARARGESIVVAGDRQAPETQLLAHALNAALGNFGQTVFLTEPALLEPEGATPLGDLAAALRAGQVGALLIVEADPALTAPPELELARLLKRAQSSFHLTSSPNETSRACHWTLPLAHYLESWGDARAYDGTLSYVQPLIEPMRSGWSALELLASLAGLPGTGYELLREHTHRELGAPPDLERIWEERVQRGFVPDSGFAPVGVAPDWTVLAQAAPIAGSGALELNLEASPSVYDGRFAGNAWLLELPHPLTKQTWGNAAVIGPGTAAKLGVETGRVLEAAARGRKVRVPALVLPGHAEGAATIELGWGRDAGEPRVGTNAYPLFAEAPTEVRLTPTDGREDLAITQEHWRLAGRPIAFETTLAAYAKNPGFTREHRGRLPSWLPSYEQRGPQWAMTIDTTICTGCSSCVVACQAENNVPVVGKREVLRSREMHWLRIDRYFVGPPGEPRVVHQPMLCQHCEQAPCEYVCPVNATVHSPDGLNEMVYNRCIGTRFCSNNCPYKVRRFNWFDFSDASSRGRMQKNPEVTVRERGVMEKCTYCVQRLRRAEIRARKEGRAIAPGEVMTACQQACPTRAIQFGLLEHAETDMVRWRREQRVYAVLHDLGTRPRTLYLAKLRNSQPEYGT